MKIIGEIIGVLGIIVNFLIYQQNDRKKLLKVKLLSDITWCLHYGFISAFSGMAVTTVGAIRETTFLLTDENENKRRKRFLIAFTALACVTSILTMKDWFGLLPAVASIIAVFSYWQQKPKLTKILGVPISLVMLFYDIMRFSIMGMANEILTLISVTVSLILTTKNSNKNSRMG